MPQAQYFSGNSTDQGVLRAAMLEFAAHGYQRTSMDAIAKQAMVSRPTLYTYFKNKQAILRAVSQGIHKTTLTNVNAALGSDAALETRLLLAFEAWSTPFQGILFGSPHGAELIGASSALAADISAGATDSFQRSLVNALTAEAKKEHINLRKPGLTPKRAAEFLILSLNGLSSGETTAAAYSQRLKTLVTVFLAAVTTPTKPTS